MQWPTKKAHLNFPDKSEYECREKALFSKSGSTLLKKTPGRFNEKISSEEYILGYVHNVLDDRCFAIAA